MKKSILILSFYLTMLLSAGAQNNTNLPASSGNAGSENTGIGYSAGDNVTEA